MKLQRERETEQYVGHKSSIELPKKFAKRLVRVIVRICSSLCICSIYSSICVCLIYNDFISFCSETSNSLASVPEEQLALVPLIKTELDVSMDTLDTAVELAKDQPDADNIKMFVGQIPKTWDEHKLRRLFEQFGRVHTLNVLRDKVTSISRGEFGL